MNILREAFPDRARGFKLTLNFANVLNVMQIHELSTDLFSEEARLNIALGYLIKKTPWSSLKLRLLKVEKRVELLQEILKLLFGEDLGQKKRIKQPSFDFEEDSAFIYGAFYQAYNIDLRKQDINWFAFMDLFKALPQGTMLAEIMKIRTQPLPKPNKHNGKQRAEMLKAKKQWALKKQLTPEQMEQNFQADLDDFGDKLIAAHQAKMQRQQGGD